MTKPPARTAKALKILGVLLLCGLIIVGGFVSRYLIREERAKAAFSDAVIGQSEQSIVQKLGPPDQVLDCGEHLWWNGDQANPPKNDGRCTKWARYNFFLHAYAFGYSKDGQLVSRYEYVSE